MHGHADSGNDDCSPEEELLPGRTTSVRIDILQKHVEVRRLYYAFVFLPIPSAVP